MTFRPAETFPPGEFLREELEERGWSQLDFAAITGKDSRTINEIIKGKRSITPEVAIAFGKALDTSAEVWLNLEAQYRLWRANANSEQSDEIARRVLLYKFPIREMSRRGWIDGEANLAILEHQLKTFIGEDSLGGVPDTAAALRKTGAKILTPAQLVWLCRCKQLAEVLTVPAYSEKKLRSATEDLCRLLRAPEDAREVARILANAGVRYVIVEGLPGLKIDGVCFWLNSSSPVIAMSLRYDRIDNFWFVLRHEIEHVLRGDAKGEELARIQPDSDLESAFPGTKSARERAADEAAAAFCLPPNRLADFIAHVGPYYARKRVEAFAKLVGVHPGLIVGQLHKRQELPQKNLRKLLAKIRAYVIETAFTDGWGVMPQFHPRVK